MSLLRSLTLLISSSVTQLFSFTIPDSTSAHCPEVFCSQLLIAENLVVFIFEGALQEIVTAKI